MPSHPPYQGDKVDSKLETETGFILSGPCVDDKGMTAQEELQQTITNLLDNWISLLDIHMEIKVRWSEAYHEEDENTQASTRATWELKEATITFYLPVISAFTEEQLETLIIHELVHCILSSMESHVKSKYTEQCEFAVESMCRSLLNLKKSLSKKKKK